MKSGTDGYLCLKSRVRPFKGQLVVDWNKIA